MRLGDRLVDAGVKALKDTEQCERDGDLQQDSSVLAPLLCTIILVPTPLSIWDQQIRVGFAGTAVGSVRGDLTSIVDSHSPT